MIIRQARFGERFVRFVYIDRVVVGQDRRQAGVGSMLYADVERYAVETGAERLTCEVNLAPPNPPSLAFHRQRGFAEVGTLSIPSIPGSGKIVSLLVKPVVSCRTS